MRHPSEEKLALLAGGELAGWQRWMLNRHVDRCPQCRSDVRAFRGIREEIREVSGELPAGLNWDRLADEMKANIRLGVAAGECIVKPSPSPDRLGWRAALALSMLTLLVLSGWWLQIPISDWRMGQNAQTAAPGKEALQEAADHLQPAEAGVLLQTTRAGIELNENGRTLTLMNPRSVPVAFSVSAQGAMRARYVDSETGQVTIHNVYVE